MSDSDADGKGPVTEVQILHVKSRFAMLATRPGGKPAAALIGAADAFLRNERGRYLDWVDAALHQLDVTLEDLPGTIPEALLAAYHQAMQIRDLGATFGAPLVTEAADSLCELLYRLHAAGLYNAEAIATHQSVLRLVCAADQKQDTPPGLTELLTGLKKIAAKFPRPQRPARAVTPAQEKAAH